MSRPGPRPLSRRYTRYTLGGVATGATIAAVAIFAGARGGSHRHAAVQAAAPAPPPAQTRAPQAAVSIPTVTGPVRHSAPAHGGATTQRPTAVAGPGGATIAEVPDPEAANSSPAPSTVHHSAATTPAAAGNKAQIAQGAPSDAEVRRELAQMNAALAAQRQAQQTPTGGGGSIGGNGTFTPPPGTPAIVARVIAGGNAIADFPYVFGGGHASFVDVAYDCSGSVSYALAAAGLLSQPETSGELESWGVAGPGKWITVEASAGHVYMYVAGMRFDTSFRSGVFGSRWQPWRRTDVGFVARHWPGL